MHEKPGRTAWTGWRQREQRSVTDSEACFKGRDRVGFDSRSTEFSQLVGDSPTFTIMAEDAPRKLRAHEGATYIGGSIVFTSKPFRAEDSAEEMPAGAAYLGDIRAMDIATGRVSTLWRSANLANGATVGPDGRLYVCFQGQQMAGCGGVEYLAGIFAIDPCDKSSGALRPFEQSAWSDVVSHWSGQPFNSPNDVVVRRADGGIWFTDPSYAHAQGLRTPPVLGEWVWRCQPPSSAGGGGGVATGACASSPGVCEVVADGFNRPNGLAFSPDERTLYVTDTGHATGRGLDPAAPRSASRHLSVYAFDVSDDGRRLANRRLIYVSDAGIPDGIKADCHGRLYAGCADGVHVLSPNGALLGKILVRGCEGGVANLCFGQGAHAATLFALAEGAVVAVTLNGTRGALIGGPHT